MNLTIRSISLSFALLSMCVSCKKYLDKLPNKSLATPSTLVDYWALFDFDNMTTKSTPSLNNMGTDDYYFTTEGLQAAYLIIRNCYLWNTDIYEGQSMADWNQPYHNIYTANIILAGLKTIELNPSNQTDYHNLQGSALFLRAFLFSQLEETFGKPYVPATAKTDLGIPLRLTDNLNDKSHRATVQQTYDQIKADLLLAKDLVPQSLQTSRPNRPTKPAVFALLARICLTMQDYHQAGLYADSALQLYNVLMDYNTINPTAKLSFSTKGNEEILYTSSDFEYGFVNRPNTAIDTLLYRSYADNDLRKVIFFRDNPAGNSTYFKGDYTGKSFAFSGLATDEMYLIKAEVAARENKSDVAIEALNALLSTRWVSGTYIPLVSKNADEILKLVLTERRKELIFRGQRWVDLRRLNQDPRFATTLKRLVNGQVLSLQPNDPKYTYPIPDDEIRLSGFSQNDR